MLQSIGGNKQIVEGAKQAATFLYGSSKERKLKFAESNAGLLSMSIMIAAKEYGVDTHPMSGAIITHMTHGISIMMPAIVLILVWANGFIRNPELLTKFSTQ